MGIGNKFSCNRVVRFDHIGLPINKKRGIKSPSWSETLNRSFYFCASYSDPLLGGDRMETSYMGPSGNGSYIDDICSKRSTDTIVVDDQPLELNRIPRIEEEYHDLEWLLCNLDIVEAVVKEHEGTLAVFYY